MANIINPELESIIACIHSTEWRDKFVKSNLEENDFENEAYGWIFKNVIKEGGEDEITYDLTQTQIFASNQLKKNEELFDIVQSAAISIFREINRRKKENKDIVYSDFSLRTLHSLRRKRLLKSALGNIVDGLEKGEEPDRIFDRLQDSISKISPDFRDLDGVEYVELSSTFESRLERNKEEFETGTSFKFLSPVLREMFHLNINSGEQFGIMADTGIGKSLMINEFSVQAVHVLNGLNTLVIITENELKQAASRIDSIYLDYDYGQIYKGEIDPTKSKEILKKYENWQNNPNMGKLFVASVIPNRFDALTIENIINRIENEHNLKIECLMIDSPEHQKPIIPETAYFMKKAMPYWDNKALVRSRGIIGFCTLQRKIPGDVQKRKARKGDDQAAPRAEEAAGSAEIPRVLDYMLAIESPSLSDELQNRLRAYVVKARNVEKPKLPIFIKKRGNSLKMHFERGTIEQSQDTKEKKGKHQITKDG